MFKMSDSITCYKTLKWEEIWQLLVGLTLIKPIIINTGCPNKNRTFYEIAYFVAITDIIVWFLLKCLEITAENNKWHLKQNEC